MIIYRQKERFQFNHIHCNWIKGCLYLDDDNLIFHFDHTATSCDLELGYYRILLISKSWTKPRWNSTRPVQTNKPKKLFYISVRISYQTDMVGNQKPWRKFWCFQVKPGDGPGSSKTSERTILKMEAAYGIEILMGDFYFCCYERWLM